MAKGATKTKKGSTVKSRNGTPTRGKAATIRFSATLLRPAEKGASWTFLKVPKDASGKLPSRGAVGVAGTFNGVALHATLEPDGEGGHWLKVDAKLRKSAGVEPGDVVELELAPVAAGEEPEPEIPADVHRALAAAAKGVREAWADITPAARRDWIAWMTSGKLAATRVKRIATACDMLSKGKRRPCCFDRSGMYSNTLSCPATFDE